MRCFVFSLKECQKVKEKLGRRSNVVFMDKGITKEDAAERWESKANSLNQHT